MSIVTRKIELIPDIENLTHEESNQRCYKLLYNIGSNNIVVFLTIQYYFLSLRHE